MKDAKLAVVYDEMMARLGEADDIEREDIEITAKKYWRDLLAEGYDATSVAEAMSSQDVFDNWNELVAAGAKLDAYQNMYELGSRFGRRHFRIFAERGVTTDQLIRFCFGLVSTNDVNELLEDGLSIETIWGYTSEGELAYSLSNTRWLLYELRIYLNWGIPQATIAEWLKRHMNSSIVSDMFDGCQYECWDELGIDTYDYEEEYLEHHFQFDGTVDQLTRVNVRIEKLLAHISAEELVENVWDFDEFVREFAEKFDFTLLAKKFLAEIGYSPEFKYFDAMWSLIDYDSTPFGLQKFIDCVDVSQLDADDKERYHKTLLQCGVEETYLAKFLA